MGYLEILLSMKDDILCLHLPVLDIHLIATEDNGYVIAHAHQITVPVGNVLVSDTSCHVEHDDGTLSLNVVTVPQPPKLLLPCSVPHVEPYGPAISVEHQRVNFNAQGGWREGKTSSSDVRSVLVNSPTYFFSNSPVRCLFTNVVFPVPPSPTKTSYARESER